MVPEQLPPGVKFVGAEQLSFVGGGGSCIHNIKSTRAIMCLNKPSVIISVPIDKPDGYNSSGTSTATS